MPSTTCPGLFLNATSYYTGASGADYGFNHPDYRTGTRLNNDSIRIIITTSIEMVITTVSEADLKNLTIRVRGYFSIMTNKLVEVKEVMQLNMAHVSLRITLTTVRIIFKNGVHIRRISMGLTTIGQLVITPELGLVCFLQISIGKLPPLLWEKPLAHVSDCCFSKKKNTTTS